MAGTPLSPLSPLLLLCWSLLQLTCADLGLEPGLSVLHNGRTVARLESADNSITFCNLSIVGETEKDDKLADLEANNITVAGVDFATMMEIIEYCENLTRIDETFDTRVDKEEGYYREEKWCVTFDSGTVWCGVNDIAESYTSLGTNQELDRCCRVHDFCPHKIKPFSTKSGLFNPSPWTRSNCECEKIFHDCLVRASSPTADSLGRFYFNFLQLKCIDIRHPARCSHWTVGNITEEDIFDNTTERIAQCQEFTEDHSQPKTLQFIKTNLEY